MGWLVGRFVCGCHDSFGVGCLTDSVVGVGSAGLAGVAGGAGVDVDVGGCHDFLCFGWPVSVIGY